MILVHDSIEFHNAAALEPLHGLPGLCPVRLPRAVRTTLNPRARFIATQATGCELRFVSPSPNLRLTLQAHEAAVRLHVYCGEFGHSDHALTPGETRILHLTPPERFPLVPPARLRTGAFSPDLWRIQIADGNVSYLGLESFGEPVRPPSPAEKPRLRWLAYGSSITHSWSKGYPHQAARRLRVDVLNKGLSGSCHCEPEIATHFTSAESWDFATLELGVNMRGLFTPEQFADRARTFLHTLLAARPGAPVFLLTHFPNLNHHPASGTLDLGGERQLAYDATLRTLAREHASASVHLLEGADLLPDFHGLGIDLLHPSDYGHIQMGENLARLLAPFLPPPTA